MPSKYARKQKENKPSMIYICCEGEKTEPNYFNGLIDYLKLSEAKVYIIDKEGGCSSPKHVFEAVETEIKELKKMRQYLGVEKFWLVMDVDKWNGQLNEVIAQCHNKKNLFTAISNPCFEVWFLCHYFSKDEILKEADKLTNCTQINIKLKSNSVPGNYMEICYEKTDIAVETTKELTKENDDKSEIPQKIGTYVYKLVEEIKSLEKNNKS
ncbi:MAG: RloB family protein [Candidatus Cloacimonadaceae bacterium]